MIQTNNEAITIFGIELFIGYLVIGSIIAGLFWLWTIRKVGRMVFPGDTQLLVGAALAVLTFILMDFIIAAAVLLQPPRDITRILLAWMMGMQIVSAIAVATSRTGRGQ